MWTQPIDNGCDIDITNTSDIHHMVINYQYCPTLIFHILQSREPMSLTCHMLCGLFDHHRGTENVSLASLKRLLLLLFFWIVYLNKISCSIIIIDLLDVSWVLVKNAKSSSLVFWSHPCTLSSYFRSWRDTSATCWECVLQWKHYPMLTIVDQTTRRNHT